MYVCVLQNADNDCSDDDDASDDDIDDTMVSQLFRVLSRQRLFLFQAKTSDSTAVWLSMHDNPKGLCQGIWRPFIVADEVGTMWHDVST